MSINLKALPEGWSTLFLRQTLTYGKKEAVYVLRMVERWPLYALDLKTNLPTAGLIVVDSIQLERAEVLFDTTYVGKGPKGEEIIGLNLSPVDAKSLSGKSLKKAVDDHPMGREYGLGYRVLHPNGRAQCIGRYTGLVPPGKTEGDEFEFVLAISGPRDRPLAPYVPPAVETKHDAVPIAQVAFPSKKPAADAVAGASVGQQQAVAPGTEIGR